MAYTSVIPVRRLDRTVDYVQNKEKTTPKSLEEAVDYAANRDKTESACFETGLGCTTTSAFEDMRLNTLRWHKETGVQGYHLVQSFAEGEVTPELAHQIVVTIAWYFPCSSCSANSTPIWCASSGVTSPSAKL